MSNNRPASEFRTILTRINEIKTSLQESDREVMTKNLEEINDSMRIMEGNQADFSDALFKAIQKMQTTMDNSFKALESRIDALEARLDATDVHCDARNAALLSPATNSPKKRKITPHPDLSVSELEISFN